jgi:hypothetical protein
MTGYGERNSLMSVVDGKQDLLDEILDVVGEVRNAFAQVAAQVARQLAQESVIGHGVATHAVDEQGSQSRLCRMHDRSAFYQRKYRGPSSAPATAGSAMPMTYQTAQNGTPISGQWRQ